MARANLLRPSVNAGELSPRMAARVDMQQYPFAAETLENLILLPEGGFMRRPGSRHVAAVKDSAAKTRLMRFRFNTEQAYVLEAGNNYLRFYKDQGRIAVADTDAAITNGDFTSDISGWTDRSGMLELPFDAETSAFTVGLVVTGAPSTAFGTIVAINKGVAGSGNSGVLTLNSVTGTFADNDALTDTSTGSATANFPTPLGTAAAITHDSANGRLNLDGLADDYAWAEQAVTTTQTGIEHVLKFRVRGAAADKVQLRVGSSGTGNDLVEDAPLSAGYHMFAFTPNTSPFYVQFRAKDKTVQIDGVSLTDNAPLELETPWVTADLPDLRSAQSADIRYIAHGDHPVYRLLRYGHASWSLEEVAFSDGPYFDTNATTTTLTPAAAAGYGIAVTASRIDGINGGAGFKSTDVGRLLRIKYGSDWGYGRIVGVTSSTGVTVDIKSDFGDTTGSLDWALGVWSATTGYPQTVTFYEGRLAFAASADRPQSFWLSQSQDFENMRPDSNAGAVEDDDAIFRTIAATEVNAIQWMSPGPALVLGTSGAEWSVRSSLQDEPITPANVNAKPQTTRKCAAIDALQVDEATLFVQAGKRSLLAYGYGEGGRGFEARDLTALAGHVGESGIAALEFQEEPWSVVWARREDGDLAALTFRPRQDVVAWARHRLGGAFGAGHAVVESMVAIPGNAAGNSEDRDELWLIVKRTVNGATVRYVEFFERSHEDGDEQADAFYVDSGLTYDGAATDTITGLGHLESETVKVLADGAEHPERTVSGGQITLDAGYSVVQAGLFYASTYKSLKAEGGAQIGTALTQTKRIGPVGLVLHNTLGLRIGPDTGNLTGIPFRAVGDPMDEAVPLFTGEKTVEDFPGDWESDPRIVIQTDSPLPMTVLAVVPRVETNDTL